jgi:hypothetical protein
MTHSPGPAVFTFGAEAIAELIQRSCADQINVHLLQASAGHVQVGVIESRHDEMTAEIDNPGVWPPSGA